MSKSHLTTRRRFMGTTIGAVASGTMAGQAHAAPHSTSSERAFQRASVIKIAEPGLRRIAIDPEQHLLVAAGKSIIKFSETGQRLDRFDFERPVRCLTVTGSRIMVGIRDHVRVLDPAGRLQTWLPTIGQGHLVGDVLADDHTVTVTDVTEGTLKRFGPHDQWKTIASRKNQFELSAGSRWNRLRSGRISTTNPGRHRIELRDDHGQILSSWGKRSRQLDGFQGCCNPLAAASLSDGTTITAEAGQVRLKQFDSTGQLVKQISGPEDFDQSAFTDEQTPGLACAAGGIDLAVSGDDAIWMLHAAAKQVIGWRVSTSA